MKTLGTSQTYTNGSISGAIYTGTGATTAGYMWSAPTRLEVNELIDSIEMIYEETSLITNALAPEKRYFKIVFSCVDGKWNKSERIYGKKIEGFSYFEF